MSSLFQIQQISKSYGQTVALRGLSVSIPEGAVGLLGPNGAGKTTLLKILLGLLRPDGGQVFFREEPLCWGRRHFLQSIGYMPEKMALLPSHTPLSYLLLLGELSGMSRQEALEAAHRTLYEVGLGEERYRSLDTLSLGQKQRVLFAQALVHNPTVLVLDEPTTGLDPQGRREFLSQLKKLVREEGKSLLFSSHILEDIQEVCDYILLLQQGECRFSGKLEDWLSEEDNLFFLRLEPEERTPSFRSLLLQRQGQVIEEASATSWVVRHSGGVQVLAQIAQEAEILIREIRPFRKSLERAFGETVGESPSPEVK